MPIGSDFLRANREGLGNPRKGISEQDSTDKPFCYEKYLKSTLNREMWLTGSVFNYLPHIYIKETRFSHQWENLITWGTGKRKKNPLWKGSLTVPVKVDVLEYVSWTNQKYKNKRWLKIVYLHLAIGNYVFQPEKTLGKLLEEFSFGSRNRWARVLLRHRSQSQKLLNSAVAKASYNTVCSSPMWTEPSCSIITFRGKRERGRENIPYGFIPGLDQTHRAVPSKSGYRGRKGLLLREFSPLVEQVL